MTAPFAALHESGYVMVFGRRRITKDAEHSGPAYENRQRTKPRGEGTNSRAVFGVSARTEGRFEGVFLVQPERYGTKIAKMGKVTSAAL